MNEQIHDLDLVFAGQVLFTQSGKVLESRDRLRRLAGHVKTKLPDFGVWLAGFGNLVQRPWNICLGHHVLWASRLRAPLPGVEAWSSALRLVAISSAFWRTRSAAACSCSISSF